MGGAASQGRQRRVRASKPFTQALHLAFQDSDPIQNEIEDSLDSDSDYEDDPATRKRKAKAKATEAKQAKRARTAVTPKKSVKSLKPFRFLDLPAELRNKIYDYALVGSATVEMQEAWKKFRRIASRMNASANPLVPALLAVNQQIHSEAAAILYGSEFIFTDTQALYNFLSEVGSHRKFVRRITMKSWGYSGTHKAANHPAMTMLSDAVNLSSLKLQCNVHLWSSQPKRTAERFYRDAHHWLEAVGTRMGDRCAAFELLEFDTPDDESFQASRYSRRYWGYYGRSRFDTAYGTAEKQEAFFRELGNLLKRQK